MSIEEIEKKCNQLRELGMDDSIIDMQRSKWMEQADIQEKNLYNPSKPAAQEKPRIDEANKIAADQQKTGGERASQKHEIFGSNTPVKNKVFKYDLLDDPTAVRTAVTNRHINVEAPNTRSGRRNAVMTTMKTDIAKDFKFGDDFNYDTSTDERAKAAYRVNKLSERIRSLKDQKKHNKDTWTKEDDQAIKDLTTELKDYGRWYEVSPEELEAQKNTNLMENKKKHVKKQQDIDTRRTNRLSFEYDNNGDLAAGKEFNIPFDKNASVTWGLSYDDLSKGAFPLHVRSGGREQVFLVPYTDVLDWNRRLNKWADDGTMSVSYQVPEEMSEKNAYDLRTAMKNGHFADTILPYYVGGKSIKENDKKRGVYYSDFDKNGQQFKSISLPGLRDYYNIDSPYNSKDPEIRRQWDLEHAQDYAAAEELGLSLSEYYDRLNNEIQGSRAIEQGALESDIFSAYDPLTGRLKKDVDPEEYKEKLYKYLNEKIHHGNYKAEREKANRLLQALKDGTISEQHDAMYNIPKSMVSNIRKDLRDVEREKNLGVQNEVEALLSTIRKQQGFKNRLDEYNNLKNAVAAFDELPDNITIAKDGTIFAIDDVGEPSAVGNLRDLIGGISANKILQNDLFGAKPIAFSKGDDGSFISAIDGLDSIKRRPISSTIDSDIEAMQAAYDAMGGDEQYNAWKNFLLTDMDKVFNPRTMGTLPRELRKVQATDIDGNPLIGANGKPVMVPYILTKAVNPELEEEYEKAGVPSRKYKRDYLSYFKDDNGELDEDLYYNWLATNLAYKNDLLKGASLWQDTDIINNQEDLDPETLARNAEIINNAQRLGRLNNTINNAERLVDNEAASDRAKLAARDALRRRYSKFMSSLLAPDEDLEDLRPEEIRNLGLAAGEWRNILPFNMYAQLNTGDADRDTKAMAALIARLRQMGKI